MGERKELSYMKKMTFGSIFAGIGGFDLGLERAGMTCKWQVEVDPFCQKVLARHWPKVRRYSDVRECGQHNLETVDLVVGGFPCQPHSTAGKRRGANDDRDLWPEYRRIIGEIRPNWVVAENVPGIRTTILDQVLSDLEGMAYSIGTLVVPACAFNAPHRRDRVFIIANSNSITGRTRGTKSTRFQRSSRIADGGNNVAHANGSWKLQQEGGIEEQRQRIGDNGKDVAYSNSARLSQWESKRGDTQPQQPSIIGGGGEIGEWWDAEPRVGRVANGIPNRVDRLRALGNAVVPQVVEWLGRHIIEVDRKIR